MVPSSADIIIQNCRISQSANQKQVRDVVNIIRCRDQNATSPVIIRLLLDYRDIFYIGISFGYMRPDAT